MNVIFIYFLGEERRKVVDVRVLDSRNSPSCKPHWERLTKSEKKLSWEWTAPNSVAMIPCPKGFFGYVQRPCVVTNQGKVQWGRSDFSRCISERLKKVNLTVSISGEVIISKKILDRIKFIY